ncbi:uncharacterized protein EKO05_0010411 [Ascochyta rabiei]|uniref:uncharacterized protein n=1 Tax=Didymella rabiei TaxID=5454 RepID=UPI0021FC3AA5|nr:uncharacterized protein EKO05_0010411 [Ascochyta rabiei]UPX20170.1 hypothetical protein EKO05_0010411 [Ascochyta rabiei]
MLAMSQPLAWRMNIPPDRPTRVLLHNRPMCRWAKRQQSTLDEIVMAALLKLSSSAQVRGGRQLRAGPYLWLRRRSDLFSAWIEVVDVVQTQFLSNLRLEMRHCDQRVYVCSVDDMQLDTCKVDLTLDILRLSVYQAQALWSSACGIHASSLRRGSRYAYRPIVHVRC